MKNKIFKGLIWSYAERFSAQIVSFLVSIVLARIIGPDEYGVIAICTIFITIANVFVTDGFGSALIQKDVADDLDFSSVFVFSECVALLVYAAIFILSPYIAAYYEIPVLCSALRVMGIHVPIAALNSIQRAKVSREMEFRKFFYSTFIGTIISATVGIAMAYMGFGIWALVTQYLVNSFIDTTILLFTAGWHPEIKWSAARIKPLASFGIRVLVVSLMTSIYGNIRNLIIGKKYTASDLAYCNRGQAIPALISTNISASITSVIFPAISSVQGDTDRVLQLAREVVRTGTFLMAPLLFGMAAVGEEIVSIMLTDKWLPCVPYLQIMCIVYLLQPVQQASVQSIKALGMSKLYLRLEIWKKVAGIIILLLAVIYSKGVQGIVFSALIAEVIATVVNFPFNKKWFGYGYIKQVTDMMTPIGLAGLMWAGLVVLNGPISVLTKNTIGICFIKIVVGAVIYLGMAYLLRVDSFYKVINLIRGIWKKEK